MSYERLTERQNDGTVEYLGGHNDTLATAYDKLKYRLAKLEDMIESEQAVILPCKVGDTVYEAIKGMPILEWEVESLSFNTVYPKGVLLARRKPDYVTWKFWGEDFGNKIFTTKEAAEAKLKELRGQ